MKKLPTTTEILDFSDEELENFYEELTNKYKQYYYAKNREELGEKFNQVLKKSKVKNGTQIAKAIAVATEEKIRRQIHTISCIQYLRMAKTKDYGELGETRVVLSFCRQLLNVPSIREVTQNEVDAFFVKVAELQRPYEKYTVARLERLESRQKVNILGKQFDFFQDKEINKELDFLSSENRMIVGYLGKYRSILYGYSEVEQKSGYTVLKIMEEEARTPANVLSIAAVVGGRHIAIRYESCETIFANKWKKMYEYENNELRKIMSDDYGNIGEMFKIKALEAYKFKISEALEEGKEKFINEMLEGLLVHELGHGIVINELLEKEAAAFGEAMAVLGSNIVSVQKEILADWAPQHEDICGPLLYFAKLFAKDEAKAARLLYVYLSDNWFLGTSTDNFGNHTDIMVSMLLPYFNKNSECNFAKLLKELKDKKGIFSDVLNDYKRIVAQVEEKVLAAKFSLNGVLKNFKQYQSILIEKVKKEEEGLKEDAVEFLVAVWAALFQALPQTNPVLLETINRYLHEENEKFHKKLLGLLGSRKGVSLRESMIENLKKAGFYKEVTSISIENAFSDIIKSKQITAEKQKEIFQKLKAVNESGLTVAIDYLHGPDPFIDIFQAVLEKSNYGEIHSPLPMGEDVSMDDGISARKISFNTEVNNLTRSIRDNLFESIKELKISKRYAPSNWSRSLLKKMKLYDGNSFITKVKKVTYEDFKPLHIFEVHIPLKRGFWDWNTIQAIVRINKKLRPFSFDGHQRIGRFFLDAMAEEYFALLDPLK